MTSKVWEVMNDLDMVTSKIVSAREIIDTALEAIQNHQNDKAETLAMAAYEFLGYYLDEFDTKFKLAWKETVSKQKEEENNAWDAVKREKEYYEGWDTTATGEKFPRVCDKDDPSPECKKDWVDFWEETYYPEEHYSNYYPHPEQPVYTEQELDAMCEAAASQYDKDKCREYNLREAEYYDKRAKLDGEYNLKKELDAIRDAGGYEWTPDPEVSRNDPNRLKYEDGWVYESPDGGKTVTKRRPGSLEKTVVKSDGYGTSKTWTLAVEESNIDGVKDYYITFPDDLLKAADLKEGDTVEWVERGDGSYELRKSLSCPPCPPCDALACTDHLGDD